MTGRRLSAPLRSAVRSVLAPLGLDVVSSARLQRSTTGGLLGQLTRCGLDPATVVDIGAAYGDWSAEARRLFPQARLLLIEPLEEFHPLLEARLAELAPADLVRAVAASSTGERVIHVHPDLVGTSLLHERDEVGEAGAKDRVVPAVTVDVSVRARGLEPPFLLKLDVQGAELSVLEGARDALDQTCALILEVSLLDFFEGGAEAADVVALMRERGFALYDLGGSLYRPLDGALAQVDAVFVRADGQLRSRIGFADPEQRRSQNLAFRRAHERRIAEYSQPLDRRDEPPVASAEEAAG